VDREFAKNVEVGDFYFKRKNYRAAADRYQEALGYKPDDAPLNFPIAQCLEKMKQPEETRLHYQEYLKILPHGSLAPEAEKALEKAQQTEVVLGDDHLLLHPNKVARTGVDGDSQLGILQFSEDNVPDKLAGGAAPIANVDDGSIGIFREDLVSTVLFGGLKGLVRIEFQKINVEYLGGRIARAIVVLCARVNATARNVGRVFTRPGVGFDYALRG
jgi:tetratricopeptide (TPR) repeat protein